MPAAKKYNKKKVTRRQRGGASATYSLAPYSVAPGAAPYAQAVVAGEACQAATKFDHLAGYSPPGRGGLPGYAGGGRRATKKRGLKHRFVKFSKSVLKSLHFFKKGTKRSGKRKQRGGAPYVLDVSQTTGGPNPFVPITKGSCEGGPVTTVQYSAPGVQRGGVGGVASPFLQMQNAGYSNEVPKWISSTGTPGGGSLIQQPYAASAMNPACLHTGGARRNKRRSGSKRRKCN